MQLLEKDPKRQIEHNGVEMKRTISGIMKDHVDLLHLNETELRRQFNATVRNPAILKQTARLGKKDSADINFIYDALGEAYTAHQIMSNQRRKFSDSPYIVHPIRVALLSISLAQSMGLEVTPELIATALMHDVIEDSPRHNGGGRMYTQENIENRFNGSKRRRKSVAANIYALSHHDVHDNGEVNEYRYYQKIKNGNNEDVRIRRIVKAADRIDNLLDPLPDLDSLYRTNPSEDPLDKIMHEEGIIFANRMDILQYPSDTRNRLYIPSSGTLGEKVRSNRVKYINETTNHSGVISLLYPDEPFLRYVLDTAIDISERTIYDPRFTVKNLQRELTDAMAA